MVTTSYVSTSQILQIRGQTRTRWEPFPTPAEIHLFLEGVCVTAKSCDQSSPPFIVIRSGQCHVLTTMPRNDNNHISSFLLSLRLCMISSWPCSSLISKSLPDWYWQTLLLSYHWGWTKIQPISSRDNTNNPYLLECLPCCLLKIHKYASPCSSPGPLETSDTGLTATWGPSDCAWGRWAPSPSCSGSWWSRLQSHGHSVAIIWVFVRACGLQLPPEQPLVLPAGVQPRLQRHHVLQLVISRQSVATGGTAVSGVTISRSRWYVSFCFGFKVSFWLLFKANA